MNVHTPESHDALASTGLQSWEGTSDIARLWRHISELEQSNGELARRNLELEAFAYTVSHDLAAPARVIGGFVDLLEAECAEVLPQEATVCLQLIRRTIGRMQRTIAKLLACARVERTALQRETVDLCEIARCIVQDFRVAEPDRDVQVSIPASSVVSADPTLLRVLLQNLLDNAWKFTSSTANPRVWLGCFSDDSTWAYYIKDNGVGFAQAGADAIFRPFARLESAQAVAGTGIGLATAKRIVEMHGGRIWAEGAPGEGATVFFTLSRPAG